MIAVPIAPGITRYYLPFSEEPGVRIARPWEYEVRILAFLEEPHSTREIAEEHDITYNTAQAYISRLIGGDKIKPAGTGKLRQKLFVRIKHDIMPTLKDGVSNIKEL